MEYELLIRLSYLYALLYIGILYLTFDLFHTVTVLFPSTSLLFKLIGTAM